VPLQGLSQGSYVLRVTLASDRDRAVRELAFTIR
jgi:hypothetical protein